MAEPADRSVSLDWAVPPFCALQQVRGAMDSASQEQCVDGVVPQRLAVASVTSTRARAPAQALQEEDDADTLLAVLPAELMSSTEDSLVMPGGVSGYDRASLTS
jgi:hypothetical protein